MNQNVLMIGNSDGIGLCTTKRLLSKGLHVTGISRSDSTIKHSTYSHFISDVRDPQYTELLDHLLQKESFDRCIYFVGIGERLNLSTMNDDVEVIDVNLIGMVKTVSKMIPQMLLHGHGHFIGLSSLADELHSAEAPSYHASKAGFSTYLESLGLALKSKGVYVTNIRFGFVDTKMAKGDQKPLMMSVEETADHIERCIQRKPLRYTAPKLAIPLVKLHKLISKT